MVSIKRPFLSNVLVWIFKQNSLLNDLVYIKFWEPLYMKKNQGNLKVSIKRFMIYLKFLILKVLNNLVL